ncbi:MAG: ATP-binding protein [Blastomonas sp.]
MSEKGDALTRIADALERIAGTGQAHATDWHASPAYVWHGSGAHALDRIEAVPFELLTGIDAQKHALLENSRRHAGGHAAHDVLLWGARGMGKSALVKSAVSIVAAGEDDLALVQLAGGDNALAALGSLFAALAPVDRRFIVFIDDIAFDEEQGVGPARALRSLLEGGAVARPANIRLYVTSNRRHIVSRQMREQDDPVNPRDVLDDKLALADRFGLSLGFHACNQDDYLAIIAGYAAQYGLAFEESDALLWSKQRGSRSGRIAWHYIVELAGRAGKSLAG